MDYPVSRGSLFRFMSSTEFKDHATKNAMKLFFNGLILSDVSSIKATCIIRQQEREEEAVFTSFRPVLNRSKLPLTTLHFTHGRVLPDDLLHILRTTPTMEDLSLLDVGPGTITGQILGDLNARKENYIARRLYTLHLSSDLDFPTDKFVGMVESRWTLEENRLKDTCLCLLAAYKHPNPEEIARLKSLLTLFQRRAQGISFDLILRRYEC
ncbi:hypothetical protein IW261DRAFT_1642104 [Armillaria novae-zelandiae]|uniref:Uncharacterized protein n=1 Tax=Armillaria novae-zelandiae TaxID=153914 RepID=A0AA39P2K5_9AGAR|nr:hypothetical protein IW261DRAFT_1642104 [Armillaria novae-zelandiae]